ncbi:MAG: L-lactate dehydrogenase [Bacilli bacterium]|nr:L-lactate dehydrogenase [Bacilli bacterium]
MKNKVAIIGCGNVGVSYAYALLNQRTYVNELVLIDINKDKALGEAMDLNHCLAFAPSKIKIYAGSYEDTHDADIICIAAGVNQLPGESRLELLNRNKTIMEDIVNKVISNGFNGIFLIATNPLDIMTNIVYKASHFPHNKVIGSGTSLDSARLRFLVGEKLHINPKNVHAYVIGEHGDSEFVSWNNTTIGLNPIKNYLNKNELIEIEQEVKNSAYYIIEKKGFTNFGIGICLVKITNAILGDENLIMTVSCYNKENDLYISSPAILNRDGIREIIDLKLNVEEKMKFLNSIETLKKYNV